MNRRWNPWAELARRDHIVVGFDPCARAGGGAVYARRGALAAIVIDPALSLRERRAALAYELVHDERGGGCDLADMGPQWLPVVSREEARVDRIAASRLVPLDELRAFLTARGSIGPVTLDDVAEEFDVPVRVAAIAVKELEAEPTAGPEGTSR